VPVEEPSTASTTDFATNFLRCSNPNAFTEMRIPVSAS